MKKISTLFKKNPKDSGLVINEVNPENQWVIDGEAISTRKIDGSACAVINGEFYKRYDCKLQACTDIKVNEVVRKRSRKPFKNGYKEDLVVAFEINQDSPNKEMGAVLKNSKTIVSLSQLEVVGRFTSFYKIAVPEGAIPCQEPDLITGHHPHWVKCDKNKAEDKYFWEAYNSLVALQMEFNKGDKVPDGTYELVGEKVNGNREKLEGHHLHRHGSHIQPIESVDFEYLKAYLSDTKYDIEGIVFHHKSDGRMCKLRKKDFGVTR